MKKKASQKSKNKKGGKASNEKTQDKPLTWVDRVMDGWVATEESKVEFPAEASSSSSSWSSPLTMGLVCWNVLADSYCNRRSHQHLPLVYQNHVFDKPQRQHHVRQILRRIATGNLRPDFLALQEVDPPLQIVSCLAECGYQGHQTATDPSGRIGRVDSCALFYRQVTWRSVDVESVQLDDLASLCSRNQGGSFHSSTRASLEGIECSFLRRNMALLVRLQHLSTGQEIVIASAHLFWNPLYPEVKLCQAHYLSTKAYAFARGAPVLVVGDMNSQPGSPVYDYFVYGVVNAKNAAPWYNHNIRNSQDDDENLSDLLVDLSIQPMPPTDSDSDHPPQVRYLLDFTLNRLCRWLRILGIDAALETEEEERMRTRDGKLVIFDRCRQEKRTLVTSSSKLVLRKDCPPGTYRLDTKALSNLELSFVHLLLCHGVTLDPKRFLSICVVCNGEIDRVHDKSTIETIFATHKAPETLNGQNLEVFQCCNCKQGYWYDERPTSSASRVKNQATKLLTLCIRGGVPMAKDMALFDFIDADQIKNETDPDDEFRNLQNQRLDVLEWLQNEELQNPFGPLRSAYGGGENGKETLPFTNVTAGFVGHLDYIFHDASFALKEQLRVPMSFEELQDNTDVRNGHLLPSNVWPSDHLAIGAVFSLAKPTTNDEQVLLPVISPAETKCEVPAPPATGKVDDESMFCFLTNGSAMSVPFMPTTSTNSHPLHEARCDCGCVPKVMSLFEMAELRKKSRAQRNGRQ